MNSSAGAILTKIRTDRRYSRERLAAKLGVRYSAEIIRNLETGRTAVADSHVQDYVEAGLLLPSEPTYRDLQTLLSRDEEKNRRSRPMNRSESTRRSFVSKHGIAGWLWRG
jgi:transcriptional regulator with XRE-family HTH domain